MTKLSVITISLTGSINFGITNNQSEVDKYPESSYIKTLARISNESQVDIIYFRSSIEIWGFRSQIKEAYQKLSEMDWIQKKSKEILFQFELAEIDRAFIRGKRDGKLTKITNATNCKWHMHESHNGYNFLMDLKDYPTQNPLLSFRLFEV